MQAETRSDILEILEATKSAFAENGRGTDMMMLAAVPVLLAGSLQSGAARPVPKEPEQPFAIYVFTEEPGDPDDGGSLGRTAEEVAKKIRDRKKWFRTVETREEADIVVEVLDQATTESTRQTYQHRREDTGGGPSSKDGATTQLGAFADIRESHTLLTRVYVPKGNPLEMRVDVEGHGPRDAAKPFAIRLEKFVRRNYWTLMEALGR